MTQLFYTDCLKAAYMLKHFEVKAATGGGDTCVIRADFSLNLYGEDFFSAGGKLYVHPDCYHIFKPQVGDLIEYVEHKTQYIAGKDRLHHEASMDGFATLNDFNKWWGDDEALPAILKRGDKIFFMPEVQE